MSRPAVLLEACQAWLNRGIAESSAARERALSLEGKRFAIHVLGTGLELELEAAQGRVEIRSPGTGAPDVALHGAPLELARLLGPDPLSRLKRSRAELAGEVRVAEGYAELLRLAEPDLEEEAARWIGDVAAHGLGEAVRGALGWTRAAGGSFERNLAEYLTEESRRLPAPLEVRGFGVSVERLRDDVERLEQRVQRLEAARGQRN